MNFADQEEIAERQKKRNRKRQSTLIWNIFTAVFIIASVIAVSYFAVLFANPGTLLNPFPPPTLPALIQLPTSTPTIVKLPATWTPSPTNTSAPTASPTQMEVTVTLPPGTTATPYTVDNNAKNPFASKGQPATFANTLYHSNSDCNWQGIAGQVWDIQGRPLVGYILHLTGSYNGKSLDQKRTLSGGAQAYYGDSGYEFVLEIGSPPIDSTGLISIQLEDQSGSIVLSNKVTLNTYADCSKNLVMVNFQQVR
ncbi:MAG: hypothetical protein AB9897_06270 [Anaerolineaceae bacterium]